jgi:general secretion pathway protein I
MRRTRGFTLLETVVALAILAMALMAIFDINSGAVSNHAYAKKLTVATLLARSKMTDLEQQLYDDGFAADDKEESGDFSREGWSQYKWRAKVIAPKTDGVSPEQLIGAIFNLPMGEGGDLGGLASMFGGGGGKDDKGGPQQGANPMAGAAMGMAQPMFSQMVQQITQTVREVRLTVYWRDGTQVESLDLVTHVVSLGPGSDRNGNSAFTPQNGAQSGDVAGQWSAQGDPMCMVVQGVPGSGGQMMHPQTGQPLVRRTECLQQRGGGGGGMNNPFSGVPGRGTR